MRRRQRRQEKFRGLPPGLMWRSPPPNCSCTDPGFLQFAFILPKIFETPKANTDHLPPQHGETRARRALNLGEKRQLLGNSPGKAPACKMRINESESTVNAGLAMLGRSARGLGEALSGLCSSTPPPPPPARLPRQLRTCPCPPAANRTFGPRRGRRASAAASAIPDPRGTQPQNLPLSLHSPDAGSVGEDGGEEMGVGGTKGGRSGGTLCY